MCAHLFDASSMTPVVSARAGPWIEAFFKQDVATAALCILYNAENYCCADTWSLKDVRNFAVLVCSKVSPTAKGSLPTCWSELKCCQGVPKKLLKLLHAANAQLCMVVGVSAPLGSVP